MKGIKATNPIAVGDRVEFEIGKDGKGIISKLEERRNYIIRKSTKLSKQTHIIASNLDQAIVVATIAFPRTSSGFIDRFLLTCEAYQIPAVLIINKKDMYVEGLVDAAQEWVDLYSSLGYTVVLASSFNKEDQEKLRGLLRGKTSLISGHSGSGKSTLINNIQPGLNLKTGEISSVHLKGMHTTTFAEMFPLDEGGWIIDTPGIKEFGIVDIEKTELSHYFPEMRDLRSECKFSNCTHLNEPGCAIMKAYEEGKIAASRYNSYLTIITGEEMEKEFD